MRGRSGAPPPARDDRAREPAAPALGKSELQERHDEIARRFAELHWDLGGIAYEMAIRDHFRLDVLVQHAARVQQADAELAEVERLLRLEDAAAAGTCSSCGALFARGAVFCWQCGNDLMERAPAATATAAAGQSATPPPAAPPAAPGPEAWGGKLAG